MKGKMVDGIRASSQVTCMVGNVLYWIGARIASVPSLSLHVTHECTVYVYLKYVFYVLKSVSFVVEVFFVS